MQFVDYCALCIVMGRVEPLVFRNVIVLTSIELEFIISIIATKSVDNATIIYSSKESFLLRHVSFYFHSFEIIIEASVRISIAT